MYLNTTSRSRNVHFDRRGVVSSGKLFFLGFASLCHWDSQEILIDIFIQIQNVIYLKCINIKFKILNCTAADNKTIKQIFVIKVLKICNQK